MVAGQAAVGTLEGMLTPTTGDGQFAKNILTNTALAGGGALVGGLVGKGLTNAAAKATAGSADDAARVARLTADAQAHGLPVNAATLAKPEGFWRNVMNNMPESRPVAAFQEKADEAIARKVAQGLGLDDYTGPINHEMLQAATPRIKAALDAATDVEVKLPTTLGDDLAPLVQGSSNKLTEGIASSSIVKRAAENLKRAAAEGESVSGRALQELNSELKSLVASQGVSATERQLAGKLIGRVNTVLTDAMTPEQATAFNAANKQYANLKAVQNMVRASGDTGTVTPRQMINAVKSGRFKNAFFEGEAPFQELAGTAAELYGPSAGKGLGNVIARALNDAGDHGITAAVVNPALGVPAMALRKLAANVLSNLAASENPTVIRLLTGSGGKAIDPTMAKYIANALGSSGAATLGT